MMELKNNHKMETFSLKKDYLYRLETSVYESIIICENISKPEGEYVFKIKELALLKHEHDLNNALPFSFHISEKMLKDLIENGSIIEELGECGDFPEYFI